MSLHVSSRVNTLLLAIILVVGVAIVAMLASGARGGPLDPSGAPAPTMKTLDDIPGSWVHALPSNDGVDSCHSSRFLCVLPTAGAPTGAGVLDRETGLVWQRVPPSGIENWLAALVDCMDNQLGGRYGWRLPRIEELRSLLDASADLPVGNPFSILSTQIYWSSSTSPGSLLAYVSAAPYVGGELSAAKTASEHIWCVRGGAGIDGPS
jgi:hypothetical protein